MKIGDIVTLKGQNVRLTVMSFVYPEAQGDTPPAPTHAVVVWFTEQQNMGEAKLPVGLLVPADVEA